jgi:ADP-ribosylglycohydrolase
MTMHAALDNALLGTLVADAVAMPVHWYYNTAALDADYGAIDRCLVPRNPHPDSILWRSHYRPLNQQAEILHDQARYWGVRGIHYHQFLEAGENTLNFKLATELYRWTVARGAYDADAWLAHYIHIMQTPGWHRDTYVEEVHRGFFTHLAQGKKPRRCAVADLHIGALSPVPSLLAALRKTGVSDRAERLEIVQLHVSLTHQHPEAAKATGVLVGILEDLHAGVALHDAIVSRASHYAGRTCFEDWSRYNDRRVVGELLTPACYLPESMTAALYLTWKYHQDFSAGVIANARVGGDNCHRGAVVGSLLGATLGVPDAWHQQLLVDF